MIGFYQITEALNTRLKAAGFKTVTFGDIFKVNLDRQDIFPLAHVMPDTMSNTGGVNAFSFMVFGLDVIDFNKEDPREGAEPFFGSDNRQDILHDILERLQNAMEGFVRGEAFSTPTQINDSLSYDPFIEHFDNVLAGWTVTFTISSKKSAKIC